MLRRKPTAITISTEDIAAFEESYARKIAYVKFLKTGEDPNGWFRHGHTENLDFVDQRSRLNENKEPTGVVDPNDELKPLPGDKARIVRSREERIIGTSGTASGR